jgi:hypothetical protein
MMRRFLLAVLLFATALRAGASDYTDIWFNPSEQSTGGGGWGVNVVQSDAFLFLTFFVYGPDNKPTWYVAGLTRNANGNFNGPLYATTGTYFGAPWNPADGAGSAQVGTATFQPTGTYTANLSYTFTAGPTVVKAIQRQSLTSIPLDGSYNGTQVSNYSNTNCMGRGSFFDRFFLVATQPTTTTLTFSFNYNDSGLTCTLSGTFSSLDSCIGFRLPATRVRMGCRRPQQSRRSRRPRSASKAGSLRPMSAVVAARTRRSRRFFCHCCSGINAPAAA